MESATLKTGDYTLVGLEQRFIIERKASTGEFAGNITQARFERELDRLDLFEFPFIVLEFDIYQVKHFPEGSGIPRYLWKELRITGAFMLKKLSEYQLRHKSKIILAGTHGKEIAESLFREVQCV